MELRSRDDGDVNRQHYALPTGPPQFASSFISVAEEELPCSPTITPISEHVRELLQEYQQNNDDYVNLLRAEEEGNLAQDEREQFTQEKYEKSVPTHGDRMIHHFVSRIQNHPGQILR
jgi:sensor domain CHASE-containing protein